MDVTEEDDSAAWGSSSAAHEGSGSSETTEAASAWNSFCEVEGREAGATGADGALGLTQHAGVAQCLLSQSEQQQLRFALCEVAPRWASDAKTSCHARRNPSRSTTAILIWRDLIFSDWSL